MQTVHLTNVHSVVIDESKIASKQLAIRAYDASNTQILNLTASTDRASLATVTIKKPQPQGGPTSVTLTPASASPLDNAASGTMLTAISVAMSDSSAFSGTISIGANSMAGISGSNVALTRALTSADDGAHTFTITATQNGAVASATLSVNVMPQPTQATEVIAFTPANPQVPSTTSKGSKVASFTVKMSDGSPFSGTVKFDAPNFDNSGVFALANVVNNQGITTGDIVVNPNGPGFDTTKTVTITDHITLSATQS